MIIDQSSVVAALVTEVPGAAQVFQRFGIDFCCGGKRTLGAACQAKGLDLAKLMAELELGATRSDQTTDAHWQTEPVAALIAHIVTRHHAYVRQQTQALLTWLDKVVQVHGERHPELARVRHSFSGMASEMAQHMAKEELLLFPAIVKMASPEPPAAQTARAISEPIQAMMREHDHTGRDLAEVRKASGDFTPPPDACATYRALYQGLAAFEDDMRQHVHLENNILFPRALALGGHGQ